jgi:hypothetical protein
LFGSSIHHILQRRSWIPAAPLDSEAPGVNDIGQPCEDSRFSWPTPGIDAAEKSDCRIGLGEIGLWN